MERTRAYRRDVRNRAIRRKKRVSNDVYGIDWFKFDGAYSKGHIGCGCNLCKYGKSCGTPLLYEVKDRIYVRQCLDEYDD